MNVSKQPITVPAVESIDAYHAAVKVAKAGGLRTFGYSNLQARHATRPAGSPDLWTVTLCVIGGPRWHESHVIRVDGWSAGPRWFEETHCASCSLSTQDERIEDQCVEFDGGAE